MNALSHPLHRAPVYTLAFEPLWDSRRDISDVWADEVEPDGSIVTAYFSHANGTCVEGHTDAGIIGIGVEDEMGLTIYHTRSWANAVLGYETLYRIEDAQTKEMGE